MQQQYPSPTMREIENMDRKIRHLKARASASEEEAKVGLKKQIKAIEDEFRVLQARVEKASTVTESVSQEIKRGLIDAWDKLTDSVEKTKKFMN